MGQTSFSVVTQKAFYHIWGSVTSAKRPAGSLHDAGTKKAAPVLQETGAAQFKDRDISKKRRSLFTCLIGNCS